MSVNLEAAKERAEKLLKQTTAILESGDVKDDFDRENAFLLYANFCGDVERTGHALGITALQVLRMADDGKWAERLRSILALKKSTRPGDLERGINRAMNFVQAQRMRLFIGRILKKFTLMKDEELERYCFVKSIRKIRGSDDTLEEYHASMKLFSDLAAAMEKCHVMSYLALNDTATERAARKETEKDDGEVSATQLSQVMADAMSKVAADQSPRAQLFDEQLKQGQQVIDQRQFREELKEELKRQ